MNTIPRVPADIARRIQPAVEALLDPEQLARIFAGVEFQLLEPFSAPEPSIGAAVRLPSGRVATLAYGKGSHLLRVDLLDTDTVNAFLDEVTLPADAITWRRSEGVARKAMTQRRAAKNAAASRPAAKEAVAKKTEAVTTLRAAKARAKPATKAIPAGANSKSARSRPGKGGSAGAGRARGR